MPHDKISNSEAIREFWDHLKDRTTVMLGAAGGDRMQPMTAFSEPDNELVWFFTRNDTDLAQEAVGTTDARLIFAAKDEKLFADISGALVIEHDRGRIDRYWNPVVAAWYPDGKDDPHLTLMKFSPRAGQVWVSQKGLFGFAFEITKANVAKTQPDLGGSAKVTF
ncbi:MAG: pyridoxamine 5'-phosphate oxidase family protein [Rhodospirillaceae bacterium]